MEYKIDKNVPVASGRWGERLNYPFADMKEGDSFHVPFSEHSKTKSLQGNLLSAARYYALSKSLPWKFTTRSEEKGIRIWRIK